MSRTTKKTAVTLMMIILISKITGFCRDIVLAQSFGAGNITDAYLTALNIPVVLFDGISAALGTTFIPMYFKVKEKNGIEEVNKFTSNVINIVILISVFLTVLGIIFAPYIVRVFAVGFKGEVFNLAVVYSRILMFAMIFIAVNGLISSYLVASGNVYISGLVTIPFNVIAILSVMVGSLTNSYIMVFGTLIAYIGQLLFQLPILFKSEYKHKLKINFKDENIKEIFYLIIPVFLGSYINQINAVVNGTLASTLEQGSRTALNYANKLNMFAVGIIAITLSTIMYPILSKLASENKIRLFKYNLSKSINMMVLIMVPISVIMMLFSNPIIKILFENGSFDSRATYLTSTALFYYTIGTVAYGLKEILSKGFYSLQDTKTPVRNATISIVINVILSIILVRVMGIGGLALASSISAIVTTALLFISLRKKIGKIGFKVILINCIKVLISSVMMWLVMSNMYNYILSFETNLMAIDKNFIALNCLVSVTIGIAVYALLVLILNVKEAKEIYKMVLKRITNIKKI